MAIEWSDVRPPDRVVSFYDHVFAETPLGRVVIEWKSWKDYDTRSCQLPWGGADSVVCSDDLDGAKAGVEDAFRKIALELSEFVGGCDA